MTRYVFRLDDGAFIVDRVGRNRAHWHAATAHALVRAAEAIKAGGASSGMVNMCGSL